jgi:hypothetical protein
LFSAPAHFVCLDRCLRGLKNKNYILVLTGQMTTPINSHKLIRMISALMDEDVNHIDFQCESIDTRTNKIVKYNWTCHIDEVYRLIQSVCFREMDKEISEQEWLVNYIGESIPAPPYTDYPPPPYTP